MDRVTLTVGSCGNIEGQKVLQPPANILVLPTSFILIQGQNKPPEPPTSILIVPVEDKSPEMGMNKLETSVKLRNENDPPLVTTKFEMGNEEGQSVESGGNEELFKEGESVAADAATQTNNRGDVYPDSLVCPVCCQTSSSLSDFQAHTLTHSVENLYICGECGESFIEENDFINHRLVHRESAEIPFSLEEANLKLPLLSENANFELSSLPEDADLELSSLPEDADFELASLPEDADLELSSLPEDADFELSSIPDQPDSEFPSLPKENDLGSPSLPERCLVSTLIEERDSESCDDPRPVNEEIFPCDECGKIFPSMAELLVHDGMHSGVKSHKCSLCPWKFRQKSNLIAHMRRHTGEKPFQCMKCHKRFRASNTLVNHLRTHTGEKPYGCTLCSKRYTLRTTLVMHMRTHTGEKPYACCVCRQAFACINSLKNHVIIHSKESFRCEVCGKTYKNKRILVVHKKRAHTMDTSTQCPVCKKKLSDKWSLVRHMRIHSRGKI